MASSRKPASSPAAQGDEALRARRAAADSQMFVSPGADSTVNDRASPEPQDGAPTVGKTSGRGAKAERPSPTSERRQASKPPVEASRNNKPPAETPKARSGRRAGPKAAAS